MSRTPSLSAVKMKFNQGFAVLIVLLIIGYVVLITLYGKLADNNKEFVNISLGVLIAKFGTIIDYFFGAASKGTNEGSITVDHPSVTVTSTEDKPEKKDEVSKDTKS